MTTPASPALLHLVDSWLTVPDIAQRLGVPLARVRRILDEGQRARDLGARGHVFNLGHGVLPTTDPGAVTHVVELVHELTGK